MKIISIRQQEEDVNISRPWRPEGDRSDQDEDYIKKLVYLKSNFIPIITSNPFIYISNFLILYPYSHALLLKGKPEIPPIQKESIILNK